MESPNQFPTQQAQGAEAALGKKTFPIQPTMPANPSALTPATMKDKGVDSDPSAPPGAVSGGNAAIKKPFHLSPMKMRLAVVAGVALLIFAAHFFYVMFTTESTDDAFVTARVHTISSRILGTVTQVFVDDNYVVKKGEPLVQLDKRDYIVQLKIAQANYSKAHKDIARLGGTHDFLPDEKPILDTYTANALTSEAQLENAQLQLEYTTIVAPEDGIIGRRSVETGQMLQPGQALMALVEQKPWVVANFKESQVSNIRVGQKAEIDVDGVPDKTFVGHVDSIAAASGSTFSLLPPDNATGNFTKIVQRIPVKVVFEPGSIKGFENRIRSGMSTEVTISTK